MSSLINNIVQLVSRLLISIKQYSTGVANEMPATGAVASGS